MEKVFLKPFMSLNSSQQKPSFLAEKFVRTKIQTVPDVDFFDRFGSKNEIFKDFVIFITFFIQRQKGQPDEKVWWILVNLLLF